MDDDPKGKVLHPTAPYSDDANLASSYILSIVPINIFRMLYYRIVGCWKPLANSYITRGIAHTDWAVHLLMAGVLGRSGVQVPRRASLLDACLNQYLRAFGKAWFSSWEGLVALSVNFVITVGTYPREPSTGILSLNDTFIIFFFAINYWW